MNLRAPALVLCLACAAACGDGPAERVDTATPSEPTPAVPAPPPASPPLPAPPLAPAVPPVPLRGMAAGTDHTCVIIEADGAVKCWGLNQGNLGLGDTEDRGDDPGEMGDALPVVALGAPALAVAATHLGTCALLEGGAVKCWGDIGEAKGKSPGEMGAALPAVDLGPGRSATAITTGDAHVCALLDDASVKCWGDNAYGQLGQGDTKDRRASDVRSLPPVDLGAGRTVARIASGAEHTCALLDDGTLKCWGSNTFGELGLGDAAARGDEPGEMGASLPSVDLGAATGKVLAIALGGLHSCVLVDDGSVACWGANTDGQLGLGDTRHRGRRPAEMGAALGRVALGTGRRATVIAAGNLHSCAILDDGGVKCWGWNFDGVLGQGDENDRGETPGTIGDALPPVVLGERSLAVTAGGAHTCVELASRRMKCWGFGAMGQLGLGTSDSRGDEPNEMAFLPFVSIAGTP